MTMLPDGKWNDFGQGAVAEEEEHDRNMTAKERAEAIRILRAIHIVAKKIAIKLHDGAPCAYAKTFADLDSVDSFLSFVWNRVEDYNPNTTEY